MNETLTLGENKIRLKNLYNEDSIPYQTKRYTDLFSSFKNHFNQNKADFFSTPGRTELSGNHTDHNNGMVIAASINLDSVACASPSEKNEVVIHSEGYPEPFIVNLNELFPVKKEEGTTAALIRGIASDLNAKGFKTGGFNACITSDVLPGSGLSSSASIEVLIGSIFNHFFNEGKISPEEIAKTGQNAENKFFGKPCGLMDQVACSVGGIITIDFKDNSNPVVRRINFDFSEQDYSVIVADTGGSHINLTDDYASIPKEMKNTARLFGKENCRGLDFTDFLNSIKKIRRELSDREILRAFHFLKENERVVLQVEALNKKDFKEFLRLVSESGNSSFKWLQNIYSPNDVKHQPVALALALTEEFISRKGYGACRVHGGGFAGTIQAFIPNNFIKEYKSFMSAAFDEKAIKILSIRNEGAYTLINKNN